MFRIYVERKEGFRNEAGRIYSDIRGFLGVKGVSSVRYLNRYDIENVSDPVCEAAVNRIFSEPQSDFVYYDSLKVSPDETQIIWEYLPGQYDQRSDSAEQCLLLLREGMSHEFKVQSESPLVRCAKLVLLKSEEGALSKDDVLKIEKYLINPVDSRLAAADKPATLKLKLGEARDIETAEGFTVLDDKELDYYRGQLGLAMDLADVKWMQDYFKSKGRDPTITEIRVLDTYWSDHCRHTTFNTVLEDVQVEEGLYATEIRQAYQKYQAMRTELYEGRNDKPVTLMDMACIGAKYLREHGMLEDLEVSGENNACSIFVDVHCTATNDSPESTERWLLQFKNETHNHPTEIEPFGGAATCIGGAIRDPLSGRSWVYQAMRITGAADPTVPLADTLPGKLPQMKLTREAAQGFASYGNQIGLTTGQVQEIYHPGFLAKRMELGAVISASPADQVIRTEPEAGDLVILLGGGTGRDGIGGATGSSKVHDKKSVSTAAAEVQKGNAVEERKIQRLFRNKAVCQMIKRCNDFGAGGVSVAVGELAPGLDINLDAVPKKYEGLDGTELAISESQERMAVVVAKEDAERFIQAADAENLNAVVVATVTDTNRMVMNWRGRTIVDIDRSFIDTAGAPHKAKAFIEMPDRENVPPLARPLDSVARQLWRSSSAQENIRNAWLAAMGDLACCSQRGLGERFDGSIGSATVLFPYGGRYQATPEAGMVAKLPVLPPRETSTVSLMAYGYDPRVADWSPYHGSEIAVLSSLTKIVCMGGNAATCRLTFQEFFGRCVDEKTWGYPAAALLGSIDAQLRMGTGSIGGKDSMSGTFEKLNVPHTLVSFAVTTDDVKNITSGSFKKADDNIYMVMTPYSGESIPDWDAFKKNAAALYRRNAEGKIRAMYPIGPGGIAEAISKMAMGNRIGARIDNFPRAVTRMGINLSNENGADNLFIPTYGSIIVEADHLDADDFEIGTLVKLGVTVDSEDITLFTDFIPNVTIRLRDIELAWEKTLAKVFPPVSSAATPPMPDFAFGEHASLAPARKSFSPKYSQTKPRVIIPVFPGTNCEYDMARAFSLNGAESKILVFRNRTPQELAESLDAFKKEIDAAQILAFSGGFSMGDEPDGSAKYIANVIREGRIADAIMDLLKKRKGLVLGICNGFQALIKTGLVPYGEIREPSTDAPTLTFNKVGRHISRIARTRLVSATSPWALSRSVLDPRMHLVPISHGEGRVILQERLARQLFTTGQVFSQYVDMDGQPAVSEPDNPNGSLYAIEGLTSPDGLVLGKMGHSERTVGTDSGGASRDLIKNVAGDPIKNERENSAENIFLAGVSYFA